MIFSIGCIDKTAIYNYENTRIECSRYIILSPECTHINHYLAPQNILLEWAYAQHWFYVNWGPIRSRPKMSQQLLANSFTWQLASNPQFCAEIDWGVFRNPK